MLSKVCDCLGLAKSPVFTTGKIAFFDPASNRIKVGTSTGKGPEPGTFQYRIARFTVAHEIGHAILYDRSSAGVARRAPVCSSAEEEYFCNFFARKLLLATDEFVRDCSSPELFTVENLERLADKYQTSMQPILIHLQHFRDHIVFPNGNEIALVSGRVRKKGASGELKFRCIACFEPCLSGFGKQWLLSPDQPLDQIYRDERDGTPLNPKNTWSLLEFHEKVFQSHERLVPADQYRRETLRCQKRKWWITTVLKHRSFTRTKNGRLVLTTGNITDFGKD